MKDKPTPAMLEGTMAHQIAEELMERGYLVDIDGDTLKVSTNNTNAPTRSIVVTVKPEDGEVYKRLRKWREDFIDAALMSKPAFDEFAKLAAQIHAKHELNVILKEPVHAPRFKDYAEPWRRNGKRRGSKDIYRKG